VKELEAAAKKTVKEIKAVKRDADDRQAYIMTRVDEVNSKVGKLQKQATATQAQADGLRADLDPLTRTVEDEVIKVATLQSTAKAHGEHLGKLQKGVDFVKSKMGQLDQNTETIVELNDAVHSQSLQAVESEEAIKEVDGKADANAKALSVNEKKLDTMRSVVDEETAKLRRENAKFAKKITELQEHIQEVEDAHEELVAQIAAKQKRPEVGKKAKISEREQKEIHVDHVKALAKLAVAYEKYANLKKKVGPPTDSQGRDLAAICLEIAEHIVGKVDMTSIQRVICMKESDEPFTGEDLSQARENLMQEVLKDMSGLLQKEVPRSDEVRTKARAHFRDLVASALDMAMSKFDQVMVPSDSLISRKAIPTCVACDRPLPGKQRAKDLYKTQADGNVYDDMAKNGGEAEGNGSQLGWGSGEAGLQGGRIAGRPASNQTSSIVLQERVDETTGRSMPPLPEKVTRPATAPIPRPENGGSNPRGSSSPGPGQTYVYRGGFRMPRSESEQGLPKLGELVSSKAKQTKQWVDAMDPRSFGADDFPSDEEEDR